MKKKIFKNIFISSICFSAVFFLISPVLAADYCCVGRDKSNPNQISACQDIKANNQTEASSSCFNLSDSTTNYSLYPQTPSLCKAVNGCPQTAGTEKYNACCIKSQSGKVVECKDLASSAPITSSQDCINKFGAGYALNPGNESFCEEVEACNPFAGGSEASTETTIQSAPEIEPITPKLQIDIPTVEFSKITQEDGYLRVPHLADYIAGVYKYGVAIASIIAIIMIMIGGLVWLTAGGAADRVGKAKEIIAGASIGLLLLLGSYTILYAINPDLVSFESLKVKVLQRRTIDEFDKSLLTSENTAENQSVITSSFENCPLTLQNPITLKKNDARSQEFKKSVNSVITATSKGEKIVQIAEAAQKCGTHFGSCGATVEAIYQLAGSSIWNKKSFDTIPSQNSFLASMKCPKGQYGSCYKGAMTKVFDKIKQEVGGGWPESWTKTLKPGDVIIVFNANRFDKYGTHSAIFMGWASAGKAKVVQGGTSKGTIGGSVCLTSSCANPQPLVRVRPY